jgi:formate hydrogenlyase subunit 6/NADH:ubiquinone oxidoreductase subunit I
MLNRMALLLLRQVSDKTVTNPFPVQAMPDSLTDALQAAQNGEIELNPAVETGERFRGRLNYDKSACIGCKLCIKVCPANATEYLPDEKKIQIHNDRCCFCAQCTEICPVKCLTMSSEYLISSYDRKAQITTDTGKPEAKTGTADEPKKKTVYRIMSDKCIGCTKCARNCPVGCISGKVKEPHVIDESACIGCGKCSEVCPKDAVEAVEIDVPADGK